MGLVVKKIHFDTEGLPFQEEFFTEDKLAKVYLSTGYGGGKTYTLCMKGFRLMTINRGVAGGLLAPTLKMYKRDVVPTIVQICTENHIRYKYNKSDMVWFFPDSASSLYIFHSEDDGASIRGPNLGWGLINEVTLCSRMAFLAFLGRIRVKRAKLPQVAMSGTPEEFNWAYEYFIENPRKDTRLIFGDSRLNIKNLNESYFTMLEDSYDPLMQEAYIKGLFVNLKGKRAAWAFDRHKHTRPDVEKVKDLPVWIHVDFNVSPMAATLYNKVPFGYDRTTHGPQGYTLQGFDEVCIPNSNTYEMCDALKSKISSDDQVTLYPDPAGRARSTKTRNRSDIDILKEAGFSDIKYKLTISVKDQLMALNNMLSKDQIVLNSKRCRNTIADLEQCVLKGNVFEIDKANENRTHWLDGVKNMVDYEFPIKRPNAFGFRQERYL